MKFSDVVTWIFYLPARIFSGMTNLLLGSTSVDKYGDEEHSRGLFGFVVDAVRFVTNLLFDATKYVARGFAGLLGKQMLPITVALWTALAVGLTVAFWPAALAAIANFTIAGVSIASLVGSNVILQALATTGLAALVTGTATFIGATAVSVFNAVKNFFSGSKPPVDPNEPAFEGDDLDATSSAAALAALSTQSAPAKTSSSSSEEDAEPVHTVSLHQDEPVVLSASEATPAPAAGPAQ
ncbi:hypothetical protein [Legionella shakespearei]|uniref:Transmembrane protein n=1 Tax=Legionella shakespearei DSM 23087 TaxID=1122169 RepID=A0A0W0YL13_9GAMM|nr:hypothetical protein [Legionella shakespearei]KTD57527.1 hypothetical protein Lsha_2368 [Legionella shakespearei DSM 23087]